MTPIDAGSPRQRFANLSPARKHLVEILRRLQFGRIEGLSIVASEPCFDPAPLVVRTFRLPAEATESGRPEGDFVLKKQLLELFQQFDAWQNAVITRLECRFGLPFLVDVVMSEDALTTTAFDRRTL